MTFEELLGDSYREGMTLDEIQEAMSAVSMPTNGTNNKEVERLRTAVSKANSEAAEYKRQLRAKQTDEEKVKSEQEAKQKELEEKYNALVKENALSKHKSRLIAQGYSEELANETATAIFDGDMDKVFANQKTFMEEHDKALKAQLMRETPKPNAGGSTGVIGTDYSKIMSDAMSTGDMATVAALMRLSQTQTK